MSDQDKKPKPKKTPSNVSSKKKSSSSSCSCWTLTTISIGVVFVAVLGYFCEWKFKTWNGIPIPGYPISFPFGSVQVSMEDPNFLVGLEILTDKYADVTTGLASIWQFSSQLISVTHSEDVEATLSTSSYRINPSNIQSILDFVVGKTSLVALNGKDWDFYRGVVHNALDSADMNKILPEIDQIVRDLAKKFNEAGREFDAVPDIRTTVHRILSKSSYDHIPTEQEQDAVDFMNQEIARRSASANPVDSRFWIPVASNRKLSASRETIRQSITWEINARKEGKKHEDFLQHLISQNKLNTNDEIVDGVLSIIFGSIETLSAFFTYATFVLGTNKDVQNKIAAEALQVLGNDEPITLEKIGKLQYTKLVVLETLRLYPPAPLVQRTLNHDIEVGSGSQKYTLVPGMNVWVPIWVVHHSTANFENPTTFNPERFKSHVNKYSNIPFSGGPRNCVGENFAIQLIVGSLARLALLTEITSVHSQVTPVSNGLVQVPTGGLTVVTSPRK